MKFYYGNMLFGYEKGNKKRKKVKIFKNKNRLKGLNNIVWKESFLIKIKKSKRTKIKKVKKINKKQMKKGNI